MTASVSRRSRATLPIDGDRIAYAGLHPARAAPRSTRYGKALAPDFINMLAHPEESLLVDSRALSDLRQGVTLEVLGKIPWGH